jgi:hypothetical protein
MNRHQTRLCILFFICFSAIFSIAGMQNILAQSNVRIFHTQQQEAKGDSYLGRDLWFAIPLNYSPTDRSTKYFNVYVNSPRNTTVNFQITGGPIIKKPVTAGKVAIFTSPTPKKPSSDLPLSTELYSSGVVEQKAIHVWSDDADIAVYFLSRRDYSSGGMYVLPPTGWGTEYIVGTYESIFDPTGQADWPSEFVVLANQDNTTVTITPNWDIRKDGFPSVVEHAKQVPFTVNLNKGECVQYQTVLPVNDNECDLTGTIITSNNPVGVEGCSVDPYIPFPYGYGDYCLSMLQPTRTWSDVYLTSPFAGRKYGGDVYCVIASKGQIVYRNGAQAAVLNFKGDHYFILDDVVASPAAIWTSDAPFELMQYIPSATFGTGDPLASNRNQGDADMCNINPADQFGKKVYFQIPTIDLASGQTEFTNYVNILLPSGHESKTTYDGVVLNAPSISPNIIKRERFPIPNTNWEAMRLTYKASTGEGSHTVFSDTGVGVYLYGYGTDDSYSWAGALGTRTHNSPDTIPPLAIAEGPCFCAHVRMYDTGVSQSHLSSFIVDTSYNMTFFPDPNFVPGGGQDSSYYDMCVIDSSIEAYLSVSIYDLAGNRTTVISTYKPQFVKFSPNPLNFGTVNVGNSKSLYDTICNTGQNPFNFKSSNLLLTNGTQKNLLLGFSIDSTGADGPIPVGGCRVVKITFASVVPPTVKDTMTLVDECVKIPCPIIGNGGAPDFDIADYSFDCTLPNTNRPSVNYFITNPSGIPIQVDSVWIDASPNFSYDKITYKAQNQPPFIVPAFAAGQSGQHEIIVSFTPQSIGTLTTNIHVIAKGVEKSAVITGLGCGPNLVTIVESDSITCDNNFSFNVPIQNTGTLQDSIISLTSNSSAKGFSQVKLEDTIGNTVKLGYSLPKGNAVNATLVYTSPGHISGCFTDTIFISSLLGTTTVTKTTTVTICVKDPQVSATNVDFGAFPFGGAKTQDFFEVCDTGLDPLTINSVQTLPPAHATSFTLANVYKVGGIVKTLPVTIAPNECLDVYVQFDPAKDNGPLQIDSFGISTNACNGINGNVQANVQGEETTGPSVIQGFSDPALFSCDVSTDFVKDTNENLVASTIKNISIKGAPNFTTKSVPPITIPPQTAIKIPIDFAPSPLPGTMPYSAWVYLTIDNGAGSTRVDSAFITAVGQGMNLTITSKFANPVSTAGTPIDLPIVIAIDKHGLNTPLTDVDIRRIELTYNYNSDILDIYKGDIKNAVKISDSALWSVDLATSKITPGTLQLNLVGTSALRDLDIASTFGTITFIPSIPKTGTITNVTLATSNFINSSAQPIPNCTPVAKVDSNFTLVYECGDSTLQKFMNGENVALMAYPVNPNPAGSTGGSVLSFKYAARVDGSISLIIYDELGKEVARVIDNRQMPAGTFEVRYNSAELPSGTYIYRFVLNNKNVSSGRLVIQK